MTFVCQGCADGLSPDEIDAEATYPDSEMGGTSADGGPLCKACMVLEMSAEELDAQIRAEGEDPAEVAERVRQVMRDALERYRADNPSDLPYEQEKAMRLWMKLNGTGRPTGGEAIGIIRQTIEEVIGDVNCRASHEQDGAELRRLRTDVQGLEDAYADICRVSVRLTQTILDFKRYHREHHVCGRDDCPICF